MDLTTVLQILNAGSALVVIVGVIFVIVQIRQNSKIVRSNSELVEQSVKQNKSNIALAIADHLTSDAFARKRRRLREIVKRAKDTNWQQFDDSEDDFEIRSLGNWYSVIAKLGKLGLIDQDTLGEIFGATVVLDWDVFQAYAEYNRSRSHYKFDIYREFKWLAERNRSLYLSSASKDS